MTLIYYILCPRNNQNQCFCLACLFCKNLGSTFSSPVYVPPREEMAGCVSSKAFCDVNAKMLAVLQVARNVI